MLSERILKQMQHRGVNQKTLCVILGLQPSNFSAFLSGRRAIPYKDAVRVLSYLRMTVGKDGTSSVAAENMHVIICNEISKQGKKIAEVSRGTGINRCMLSSYFNGYRTIPVRQLDKLVDYLNLDYVRMTKEQ